jgi:hypothetical protein
MYPRVRPGVLGRRRHPRPNPAQHARSGVRNIIVVDDPNLMATARQVLSGFINNAPAMLVHCTSRRCCRCR